ARPARATEGIRAILSGCGPVTVGTAARLYLMTRGLNPEQPALLAHTAVYCDEVGHALPALIAPITDSSGKVTAIQRIWCAARVEYDGSDNTPLDSRADLQVRK